MISSNAGSVTFENVRKTFGTIASKARSQPSSSVPAGKAILIVVPSAFGPPISVCRPVPGNSVLPDS